MDLLKKLLALLTGGALGFAVVNRTQAGQRVIVNIGAGVDTMKEAAGVIEERSQAEKNVAAFLMMIRFAEGTAGVDGYRMLFGGGLFTSYLDHPRKVITRKSNGKDISSSAAGAYQIIRATWDALQNRLGLTDFSPVSQDIAALELIREKGALDDVKNGRFDKAVEKVRKVWASLPGAGYGQPEKKLAELKSVYKDAGGVFV